VNFRGLFKHILGSVFEVKKGPKKGSKKGQKRVKKGSKKGQKMVIFGPFWAPLRNWQIWGPHFNPKKVVFPLNTGISPIFKILKNGQKVLFLGHF
jgi:hypothetical protein